MCMIMLLEKEKEVSRRLVRAIWEINKHGSGFAYSGEDSIHVHTFPQGFKRFWKTLSRKRAENPDSVFLIHLRKATKGKANTEENTQPIPIGGNTVMAHNGTMHGFATEDLSDSIMFAEDFLKYLKPGFLNKPTTMAAIESFLLPGSRMAFLSADGTYRLLNEDAGIWVDGVWFSRDIFKKTEETEKSKPAPQQEKDKSVVKDPCPFPYVPDRISGKAQEDDPACYICCTVCLSPQDEASYNTWGLCTECAFGDGIVPKHPIEPN